MVQAASSMEGVGAHVPKAGWARLPYAVLPGTPCLHLELCEATWRWAPPTHRLSPGLWGVTTEDPGWGARSRKGALHPTVCSGGWAAGRELTGLCQATPGSLEWNK